MGVRRLAVAAAVGVQRPLAVALTVAQAASGVSVREQDLAHAYREEAEGWRVLAFLGSAVMAAVRVTSGKKIMEILLQFTQWQNIEMFCMMQTLHHDCS